MADGSLVKVTKPKSSRSGAGGSVPPTVSLFTPSLSPQRNGCYGGRARRHTNATPKCVEQVSLQFTVKLSQKGSSGGAEKVGSKVLPGTRLPQLKRSLRRTPPRPAGAVSEGAENAHECSTESRHTSHEHASYPLDVDGSNAFVATDVLKATAESVSTVAAAAPLSADEHPAHERSNVAEMTTPFKDPEEKIFIEDKRGGSIQEENSSISRLSSTSTVWHQGDALNREMRSFSSVGFEAEDLLQSGILLSEETDDSKDKKRSSPDHSADDTGHSVRPDRREATGPVCGNSSVSSRELPLSSSSIQGPEENRVFKADSSGRDDEGGDHPVRGSVLRSLAIGASEGGVAGLSNTLSGWGEPDDLKPPTESNLKCHASTGGFIDHSRSPRYSQVGNGDVKPQSPVTSPLHSEHLSSFLRSQLAQQLVLQQLQQDDLQWRRRPEARELARIGGRLQEAGGTASFSSNSRTGEYRTSGASAASWASRASKQEEDAPKPKRPTGIASSETVASISITDRQQFRPSTQGLLLSDSAEADALGESDDDSGAADGYLRGAKRQRWDSEEEEDEDEEGSEPIDPMNDPGEETRVRLIRAARKFPPFRGVYFDTRRGNLSWRCSWKVHGKKRSRSWSVMKFGMERARAKAIAERMKHAPHSYAQSPPSSMNSQTDGETSPSLRAAALLPAVVRPSPGVSPSLRSHGVLTPVGMDSTRYHGPLGGGQYPLQPSRSSQVCAEEELTCGVKRSLGTHGGARSSLIHEEDHGDEGEQLTAVLRRVLSMKEPPRCSLQRSHSKASKLSCQSAPCLCGRPGYSNGSREDRNALSKAELSSVLQGCNSLPCGARRVRVREEAEQLFRCAHSSPKLDYPSLLSAPEGGRPSANVILQCLRENVRTGTMLTNPSHVNGTTRSGLGDDGTELDGAPTIVQRAMTLLDAPPTSRNREDEFLPFGKKPRTGALFGFRRSREEVFDGQGHEGTRSEIHRALPAVDSTCQDDKGSDTTLKGPPREGFRGRGSDERVDALDRKADFGPAHGSAESLAGASTTTSVDEKNKLSIGTGSGNSPCLAAQIPVRSPEALLHRVVSAATTASADGDKWIDKAQTRGTNVAGTTIQEISDSVDGSVDEETSESSNPHVRNGMKQEVEDLGNHLRTSSATSEKTITDDMPVCRKIGLDADSAIEKTGGGECSSGPAGVREVIIPCAQDGRSTAYRSREPVAPDRTECITRGTGDENVISERERVLNVLQNLKEFALPVASKGKCQKIQCASQSLVLIAGAPKEGSDGEKRCIVSGSDDTPQFAAWCARALDDFTEFARTADESQLEPFAVLLRGCLATLTLPSYLSEAEQLSLLASVLTYYCNCFECSGKQQAIAPSSGDNAA
ncbi:AP2 domain transcription factor AP2IV-3 [Toxoplasma gondii RUB]|uniref:AP2 domain transcription factor AP2IV-3 n=2 Tax=Toxoplasma gondii TaxID=5811 RepID=A0A086LKF2_TOXGO|nr:AP2 domain transcription factor AP2IV-3 [Toxoplasma gondii RUB]KFH04055.1 AP2 domain transcription factor AP2IV-3 [Toxoplasma gondii VAND]